MFYLLQPSQHCHVVPSLCFTCCIHHSTATWSRPHVLPVGHHITATWFRPRALRHFTCCSHHSTATWFRPHTWRHFYLLHPSQHCHMVPSSCLMPFLPVASITALPRGSVLMLDVIFTCCIHHSTAKWFHPRAWRHFYLLHPTQHCHVVLSSCLTPFYLLQPSQHCHVVPSSCLTPFSMQKKTACSAGASYDSFVSRVKAKMYFFGFSRQSFSNFRANFVLKYTKIDNVDMWQWWDSGRFYQKYLISPSF